MKEVVCLEDKMHSLTPRSVCAHNTVHGPIHRVKAMHAYVTLIEHACRIQALVPLPITIFNAQHTEVKVLSDRQWSVTWPCILLLCVCMFNLACLLTPLYPDFSLLTLACVLTSSSACRFSTFAARLILTWLLTFHLPISYLMIGSVQVAASWLACSHGFRLGSEHVWTHPYLHDSKTYKYLSWAAWYTTQKSHSTIHSSIYKTKHLLRKYCLDLAVYDNCIRLEKVFECSLSTAKLEYALNLNYT